MQVKRSTIFVDLDGTTRVYESTGEDPLPLESGLPDSAGWSSATLLIADRGGREEIARAMRGQPSAVQFRFMQALPARRAETDSGRLPWLFRYRRRIAGLLFPATAFLVWYLFAGRP